MRNQNQPQGASPENSEWSTKSRHEWVSLAIAAATASLRATAPSGENRSDVELKTQST
ncbi:MAG: hypothetical protein AB8G18_01320 [Gammaproteobacteria bacterium]